MRFPFDIRHQQYPRLFRRQYLQQSRCFLAVGERRLCIGVARVAALLGMISLVGAQLAGLLALELDERVSRNGDAYRYLPRSVQYLPEPADMLASLERCGFTHVKRTLLTVGIAQLITATRGEDV